MKTIADILDPVHLADAQKIEPVLDALLDQIVQHATVRAELRDETLHVEADGTRSETCGPRLQTYFRIILAGLGARAAQLSGRDFTPYQNESRFRWRDANLHVSISNRLQKMELKAEREPANKQIQPIAGKPGSG